VPSGILGFQKWRGFRCGSGLSACVGGYTTGAQDTHKTFIRQVHYQWHPWHGQQVHVRGEARRGGTEVLRCVREEQQQTATLEIPTWMFDSGLCSGMRPGSQIQVNLGALVAVRTLLELRADDFESSLIREQHLSSGMGGADVDIVSIEGPAGRAVCSSGATAAVNRGSLPADASLVGSDAERTSPHEGSSGRERGGVR